MLNCADKRLSVLIFSKHGQGLPVEQDSTNLCFETRAEGRDTCPVNQPVLDLKTARDRTLKIQGSFPISSYVHAQIAVDGASGSAMKNGLQIGTLFFRKEGSPPVISACRVAGKEPAGKSELKLHRESELHGWSAIFSCAHSDGLVQENLFYEFAA